MALVVRSERMLSRYDVERKLPQFALHRPDDRYHHLLSATNDLATDHLSASLAEVLGCLSGSSESRDCSHPYEGKTAQLRPAVSTMSCKVYEQTKWISALHICRRVACCWK